MVFGRHGNGPGPEEIEGRIAGEDGGMFGVGIEQIQLAGACEKSTFDPAEQLAQQRRFKGVKEVEKGGGLGKGDLGGVAAQQVERAEEFGSAVCEGLGGLGAIEITVGDVGELRVQFDTEDLFEGGFCGDEHGSALAGADVEEGVAIE